MDDHDHDHHDHHDAVFVDEVPRFWFSRRWRLAAFSCIALLIATSQRICIDVALVSMLNRTTSADYASPANSTFSLLPNITTASSASLVSTTKPTRSSHAQNGQNKTIKSQSSTRRTTMVSTTASPSAPEVTPQSRNSETACRNTSDVEFLTMSVYSVQDEGDVIWTERQTAGVLDAFYWADLVARIPAGLMSQRYGGKRMLGFSLLLSSLSTVLVPLSARVHFTLVLMLRFVTGLSVGATGPAVSYLLGRWSPVEERSLLFAIANTGWYVSGSVVAIPLAGLLCQYGFDGGWPSAYYVFGGLGMLWFIIWMILTADCPTQDGGISPDEKEYIAGCLVTQTGGFNIGGMQDSLFPWPVALTSLPVLAMALCHLSFEWCIYVLVRLVPIFFRESLQLDFKPNSVSALLPGFAFWCLMITSAGAADRLQAYGVLSTSTTRKLWQCIGALVTSAMIASMIALSDDCAVHWMGPLAMWVVGLAFCGIQLGSGALVSHLDLASRHAAVVFGLTGTFGATAYFAVPALIRLLSTDFHAAVNRLNWTYLPAATTVPVNDVEWRTLFIITASGHVIAALAFLAFGTTNSDRKSNALVLDHQSLPSANGLDAHIIEPLGGDEDHLSAAAASEDEMGDVNEDDDDEDHVLDLPANQVSIPFGNDVKSRPSVASSGTRDYHAALPSPGSPGFYSIADNISDTESAIETLQLPSATELNDRKSKTNAASPALVNGKYLTSMKLSESVL